jgi:prefoldin subunit 5
MKKLLSFVLAGTLMVSCADYDDRFDSLNAALEQLEAENAALEAQVAAMQGASASAAQATAAKLAEFQTAVGGIVVALQNLGDASAATIAQVSAVIAQISALDDLVASNTATQAELDAALAEIQAMLNALNDLVFEIHHSGGGSTSDAGTEHHSGGGSTSDIGSEHHSGGGSTSDAGTVTPTDNGDGALDLIVTVPAGTTAIRLSGAFWGWDPAGGPVGTDNGDGTFSFRLDPAPTADMQYLYTLDGVNYENLIDNAVNAECSSRIDGGMMVTDYSGYANRVWKVGSGDQAETFDSCVIDTVTAN